MAKEASSILEAEVVFGALRRERLWQWIGAGSVATALVALATASVVVMSYRPPAPVVVPFDPATGVAVPNAAVGSIRLDEERAVIEALAFQYVMDRETYNQIDNDIRINRALARTAGTARAELRRLWDSSQEGNWPSRYGGRTQITASITGIALLGGDRVQVRMRKRLTNPDGASEGGFTVVLKYEFRAGEEKTLEAVWQNPLGFTVTEYAVTAERRE